jgi:integrase/recombinase XerD
MAAIFHRLQLTLFHAGRLDTHARPASRQPVSVTGWAVVAAGFAEAARCYIAQVDLSLRPSTVKHIEHDLREFGTWLAHAHPEVGSCAELERRHIEAYKAWVAAKHARHTGKPLNRISIKNRLINLHCFFDRITEWGYPNPPQHPLIFAGDLPMVDKPLPRFLDDAAAAKLLRAARADPDPLSRLIVELLARTGIRRSELLGLTVDAVVQIGSACWLRIPVGKLHNDRYIPLHPSSRRCSTTGSPTTGPPGCARTGSCWNATGPSPRCASPPHYAASPMTPGSGTSPPTNCATPWPPRPSTGA